MEISEKRKRFNVFYKHLKDGKDFEKLSFIELLWKVYNQACADCGVDCSEVSMEETQKMIEDQMFFFFISDCLLHPEKSKPIQGNDYVKVTFCEPDKCVGFPDRIEEMDCEHCERTKIINLSQLCGIDSDEENLKDKILTADEVNQLSRVLQEATNAEN